MREDKKFKRLKQRAAQIDSLLLEFQKAVAEEKAKKKRLKESRKKSKKVLKD